MSAIRTFNTVSLVFLISLCFSHEKKINADLNLLGASGCFFFLIFFLVPGLVDEREGEEGGSREDARKVSNFSFLSRTNVGSSSRNIP